jgi:hypothetical protein
MHLSATISDILHTKDRDLDHHRPVSAIPHRLYPSSSAWRLQYSLHRKLGKRAVKLNCASCLHLSENLETTLHSFGTLSFQTYG